MMLAERPREVTPLAEFRLLDHLIHAIGFS